MKTLIKINEKSKKSSTYFRFNAYKPENFVGFDCSSQNKR